LYSDLGRHEEAVAFYRQAAETFADLGHEVSEGRARNNLAISLQRLRRLDEAREETVLAIRLKERSGHATEPWTSWEILSYIETDTGNASAAAEAKRKARDLYLAYRRDGGENHSGPGRLAFDVWKALLHGDSPAAVSRLDGLAARPEIASHLPYIERLKAIVAGSRYRSLAEAPELDYSMSAEILILIETLEAHEKAPGTQ
jgi:tetratricopeptide (TPR) repeat protein